MSEDRVDVNVPGDAEKQGKNKKRRRKLLPLVLLLLALLIGGGVAIPRLLGPPGDGPAKTPADFHRKAQKKQAEIRAVLDNAFFCTASSEEMWEHAAPGKRPVAQMCGSGYYDRDADVLYFTGVFDRINQQRYDREHTLVFPTRNGNAEVVLNPDLHRVMIVFAVHHPVISTPAQSGRVLYEYTLDNRALQDITCANGRIQWRAGDTITANPFKVSCYVGQMPLEQALDMSGVLPFSERAYLRRFTGYSSAAWARIDAYGPRSVSVAYHNEEPSLRHYYEGRFKYNGYNLPSDYCLVAVKDGGQNQGTDLVLVLSRGQWVWLGPHGEAGEWSPDFADWYAHQVREVREIVASKFGDRAAQEVAARIPPPPENPAYYEATVSLPKGYKARICAEASSQLLYVTISRPQ